TLGRPQPLRIEPPAVPDQVHVGVDQSWQQATVRKIPQFEILQAGARLADLLDPPPIHDQRAMLGRLFTPAIDQPARAVAHKLIACHYWPGFPLAVVDPSWVVDAPPAGNARESPRARHATRQRCLAQSLRNLLADPRTRSD